MKHVSHFLFAAVLVLSSRVNGYSIKFVAIGGNPECTKNLQDVELIIAKEPGFIDKLAGIDPQYINGAKELGTYFRKIGLYLEHPTPENAQSAASSLDHINKLQGLAEQFKETLSTWALMKIIALNIASPHKIIAAHQHVKLRNSGTGSTWNAEELFKKINVPVGAPLFVSVFSRANKQLLMLDQPIASNSDFGFQVRKDPFTEMCVAVPTNQRD